MYMDALESEVEALSAEVTRLRLMMHRVTQAMEVPPPVQYAGAAAHVDPYRASMGLPRGAMSGQPPATLESLVHVLRAFPVEMLEAMIAGTNGTQTDGRRKNPLSPGARAPRRGDSRPKPVSEDHRSENDETLTADSDVVREKHAVTSQRRHGPTTTDRAVVPQPQSHVRQASVETHYSSRSDYEAPVALRKSRRGTIPRPRSVASQPSAEDSRTMHSSQRLKEQSGSLSASRSRSAKPVPMSAEALNAEPAKSAGGPSLGRNIINAIRREEARHHDGDTSTSASILVASRPALGPVQQRDRGSSAAGLSELRLEVQRAKEAGAERSVGKAAGLANNDPDVSYTSMSALQQMLRFQSTSPGEVPLTPEEDPVEGSLLHRDSIVECTLVSVAGAGSSYYNYSGFSFPPVSGQDSARPSEQTPRAHVVLRSSDDSGIDHHHNLSRSRLQGGASKAGSSRQSQPTPRAASQASGFDPRYSFRMLGSAAASPQSIAVAKDVAARRASAMQPPSSEVSTTEDTSGLLRGHSLLAPSALLSAPPAAFVSAGGGSVVLGARRPIPVSADPSAPATPSAAGSPRALTTGVNSPSMAGVRTPHAKRSILQRIRDEAESTTDSDEDEEPSDDSGKPAATSQSQSYRPQSSYAHSPHESHADVAASSAYMPSQYTPANRSISATGADLYSLGMYTPQMSPGPAAAEVSQSVGGEFMSQYSPGARVASPSSGTSVSAAFDYDFGFDSQSRSQSRAYSPGSAASPLSWMRSKPELRSHPDDPDGLLGEGGYHYDY